MARLFGTDGVRGEANLDLKPELAFRLGRAATLYFCAGNFDGDPPCILIGRDSRVSGPMLEAALAAGICSAGGQAVIAGIVPTPGVAYLTKKMGFQAGIVVSASHNPFYDNGIKFFGGDGYKLPDEVEDEIEMLTWGSGPDDDFYRPSQARIGGIFYRPELLEDYIGFVLSTADFRLDGMKIVLDCANGAAYRAMPEILRRLGADLTVLNDQPSGININDNCGSTHLGALQKAVVRQGADIGIAHDGDADRCLCVDEKGEVMDGDHLLVICGQAMMAEGRLARNTIVTTVMANIGFHQALKKAGGRAEVTSVGDRYVLENMRENHYSLGGEQSGHIIFGDISTTGDGLITALQVLGALKKSGKRASEINALMVSYPQLLVNVEVGDKEGWEKKEAIQAAIRAAEQELGENGRILVRPSGTEPLIRVMGEGPDQAQLDRLCHDIAAVVKQELA